MTRIHLSYLFAAATLLITSLEAQVPQLINYQGRVAVDGVNFDGAGQFKFALVDGGTNTTPTHTTATGDVQVVNGFVVGVTVTDGGSGYATPPAVTVTGAGSGATAVAVLTGDVVTSVTIGNPGSGYTGTPTVTFGDPPPPVQSTGYVTYWSNDGTSNEGSEPTASLSLPVKKGLYSVLLGDATLANMTTVPATIFANPGVYLRVWFNDGSNGFQLLTPDQRIAAVGYAVMAGTVADGAITSSKLAPGAASESLAADGLGGVPSGAFLVSSSKNDASLTNQGYVYNNDLLRSTTIPDPNTPSKRSYHTAVWTDSKMIVWGGYDGNSYFNTGGVYDPVTDTWSSMTTTGAPSGSQLHSAVWTGSKMIVWGGYDGDSYLNTGGVYDPTTDTWSSMTSTGAPAARHQHKAVWTGSKMIVWGGYNGSFLNTGGVYDPVTDTWSAVTATGAPTVRRGHSAVWTGTKMVVWGGSHFDGGIYTYYNTGGVYDPTTNTWSSVTNTGAPTDRGNHSAVWTGSKMIVWGGYDGDSYLNTGGVYDPTTNTWSSVTNTGAPTDRNYHSAVWTGTKMIVWGGYDGDSYLNTGGLYDPTTDAWSAMPNPNAPTERYSHAAVWTGTKMIVWGGRAGGYFNTGGVYDPGAIDFAAWLKTVDLNGGERIRYLYTKP